MKVAPLHPEEAKRLATLQALTILDTLSEQEYDDLTAIAASICGTPIALVSLVDENRQWFKSRHGLGAPETPRDFAFCAHAILDDGLMEVPDSFEDPRFHDNPLAVGEPHVRFYAGVPVRVRELPMGTLCVIDNRPRELDDHQRNAMLALGRQVESLLALRLSIKELKAAQETRDEAMDAAAAARGKAQLAAELLHDVGNAMTALRAWVETMESAGEWKEVTTLDRLHGFVSAHGDALSSALGEGKEQALLEVITALSDMMKTRRARVTESVAIASRTVSHVGEILEVQRRHARGAPDERPLIPVEELIADTTALARPLLNERGLAFEVARPEQLPVVAGDRVQLVRVLIKLIKQASEAASGDEASLALRVRVDGEGVELVVATGGEPGDEGSAAEDREWLSACADTVNAHGGALRVARGSGGFVGVVRLPTVRTD